LTLRVPADYFGVPFLIVMESVTKSPSPVQASGVELPKGEAAWRARILEELALMFPESGDWCLGAMLARRDGRVYQASSARLKRQVAVKVYGGELPGNELPVRLFEDLTFYQSRSSRRPLLTVPKPCGVVESLNLVVMEWIHAPTMTVRLRKNRLRPKARRRDIESAARWLLWYHRQSGITRETYQVEKALKAYKRQIRGIRRMDEDFLDKQPELQEHLKRWRTLGAGIGGFEIDHAVVHHDFTPSNVFMEDERVTGFDFVTKYRKPVTHDICRFLTHLAIQRWVPVSAGHLRKHGCAAGDFEAFLGAYGEGMAGLSPQVMLYLQYGEILRRWLSLVNQQSKLERFRRRFQIFQLSRMARHVSHGLLEE
jgi:hypothetical protein